MAHVLDTPVHVPRQRPFLRQDVISTFLKHLVSLEVLRVEEDASVAILAPAGGLEHALQLLGVYDGRIQNALGGLE